MAAFSLIAFIILSIILLLILVYDTASLWKENDPDEATIVSRIRQRLDDTFPSRVHEELDKTVPHVAQKDSDHKTSMYIVKRVITSLRQFLNRE